jgi:hypothetical protein
MKKILLIFGIIILFLSCDKEDIKKTCNCETQTWIRYGQGEWYRGGSEFYSNNCEDNNKAVGQPYSGQGYSYKYIVECE